MSGQGGGKDHPVVVDPAQSRFLKLPDGFILSTEAEASGGVTFPLGVVASGISAGLKESGRADLGILAVAEEWRGKAVSAAMFTTNAFAAAPVVLDRTERSRADWPPVLVNSGNATACTGDEGLEKARSAQTAVAESLALRDAEVAGSFYRSIGVQMDIEPLVVGAKRAAGRASGGRWRRFCQVHPDHGPLCEDLRGIVGRGREDGASGGMRQRGGHDLPCHGDHVAFVTTDAELTPSRPHPLWRDLSIGRSTGRPWTER